MIKKYLIAADGGGSKTAIILADTDKNIIGRSTVTASNPTDIGLDGCVRLMRESCTALTTEYGVRNEDVAAIFFGIAGATTNSIQKILSDGVRGSFPNAKIGISHDAENIVYASFPRTDGVAVICGTGSCCFVKRDNLLHRIGGYGMLDLNGNGYEIGKSALAHALRCVDKRDDCGVLYDLVKKKCGGDVLAELPVLLQLSKTEIAAYAPLVFDADLAGDIYAARILESNISFIAEYIKAAGNFFKNDFGVCIAGGIFKSARSMEILSGMVDKRAKINILDTEPVFGALEKAKFLLTERHFGDIII